MTQKLDHDEAARRLSLPASRLAPVVGLLAAATMTAALTGCAASGAGAMSPVQLGLSAAPSEQVRPGSPDPGPSTADAPPSPTSPPARPATASPRHSPSPGATTTRTTAPGAAGGRSAATTSRTSGRAARPPVTSGRTAVPAPLMLGPGTESVAEAEVVRLVNVKRADAGCEPVTVDPILVELARAHSLDMAGAAGFQHNGADGRTPFQRMTAADYQYSVAAENIAAGQPNAAAVMSAWMASPAHEVNIQDCRFTEIGVGVVNRPGTPYVVYWTQEFGTPM